MEREKKNRPKIVAVVVAVVLIVALIVGMVSCSSGKATDPTDGTGEQLEHYPVGIVTKPTGEGSEPVKGGETSGATETTEPAVGTVPGESEATEPIETTEATVPDEGKPTDPVKPTEPKPTEPKPTQPKPNEPKPTDPVKPTEPKPTVPTPTEPKPTQPKPTDPKPTEPKPTEPTPTSPKPTEPTVPAPTEPKPTEPPVTEPAPTVHTHNFVVSGTVNATCMENGYTEYKCSCGESKRDIIPATGHSYNGVVTVEPSCKSEGTKTYTCSNCHDSYTESIPVTSNHSWVHRHTDAEGYTEYGLQCHCGWVCWESEAEAAGMDIYKYYHFVHVKSFESSKGHSCYDTSRWVETKPAKDWDICSVCGETKKG